MCPHERHRTNDLVQCVCVTLASASHERQRASVCWLCQASVVNHNHNTCLGIITLLLGDRQEASVKSVWDSECFNAVMTYSGTTNLCVCPLKFAFSLVYTCFQCVFLCTTLQAPSLPGYCCQQQKLPSFSFLFRCQSHSTLKPSTQKWKHAHKNKHTSNRLITQLRVDFGNCKNEVKRTV